MKFVHVLPLLIFQLLLLVTGTSDLLEVVFCRRIATGYKATAFMPLLLGKGECLLRDRDEVNIESIFDSQSESVRQPRSQEPRAH